MKPIIGADALDAHALALYRWSLSMQQDAARLVAAAEQLTRAAAARGLDLRSGAAIDVRSSGRTLSRAAEAHIAVATSTASQTPADVRPGVRSSGQPKPRTASPRPRPSQPDADAVNRLLADAARARR